MKTNRKWKPKYRLLKAGCVGAGLLSISNPTQVTAADIGLFDVHNDLLIDSIPNPFPNSSLGVYVAVGDLDGDNIMDIVMGPGRGSAEVAIRHDHVKCCPDFSVDLGTSAWPYPGVRVATGDLDGDGRADIIASPATGGSSRLSVIKADTSTGVTEFKVSPPGDNILTSFSGGVSVAVGDLDGDTFPEILGAKAGCKNCHGWDVVAGKSALVGPYKHYFPPLPPGKVGGLQVATGDVDGDGADEILVSPMELQDGSVAPPMLQKGKEKWIEIQGWDWDVAGVHVALGDLDGDGLDDVVAGSPLGTKSTIKWYKMLETPGTPGAPGTPGTPPTFALSLQKTYDDFYGSSFYGGVRVAVGDINGDGFDDITFAPAGVPEPATAGMMLSGALAWLASAFRRKRVGGPPG